jgi:phosphoribosylamine--glycine ligase
VRVCVVGGGGREHALADVLSRTADVVVSPGNPGIPGSTPQPPDEIDAELFVIGPEAPLVDGLADRLRSRGSLVFGPGADGARLEGSKAWMKSVLADAGVPTARHGSFAPGDVDGALAFLRSLDGLYVVKTDFLAAGKGVLVTESLDEATDDVRSKLEQGAVVLEEGLTGPELSVLAVCDGTNAVPLAPAQDFKRALDGDAGPNTGGMGAYSPVPFATKDVVDEVMEGAVLPTLRRLRAIGIDYRGVLYAGLMLTPGGVKVLEYNVRFGDPEAQVVLPRVAGDLAAFLAAAAGGRLDGEPAFVDDAAVTIVLAAPGYPAAPRTGDAIEGIDDARAVDGVTVYCAGVSGDAGALRTAGGRVLDVTAVAPTIADARRRAYDAAARIAWPGIQFRTDIAEEAGKQ